MKHISYSRCIYGAITVKTDVGTYSCKGSNKKKFFPGLDLRKIPRVPQVKSYCCDYCVNHYGLDLCGCGSGLPFGKCNGKFPECKKPMQKLGEYQKVVAADAWFI